MSDGRPAAERLTETRAIVEGLAGDPAFYVACRESGARPEPVAGVGFPSRQAAERACTVADRYRAALRDLDPETPSYDLGVYERESPQVQLASVRRRTDERRTNGLPSAEEEATVATGGDGEWLRMRNAPVVHLAGPDEPLDDALVERQLDARRQG